MRAVILIVSLLLGAQLLYAQDNSANLLVQSADGKNVKLIWVINKWNKGITGFDIKRKDGMQDWVKLNKAPILPEVTLKKNLAIVEADKTEQGRIRAKLYSLVLNHNLLETNSDAYLLRMNTDEKAVQEVAIMITHDYDIALMNGFAYVDHSAGKRINYQYGLFIAGTEQLLDTANWDYGQMPDLNVISEVTSRSTPMAKGIQIIWNADMKKMRQGDVAGFNIYREGMRLNATPIMCVNSKDPSEFTWFDQSGSSDVPYEYSISAESLFGIEGMIRPYKYNPAEHASEYRKAEVTDIIANGFYFKDGITVKWNFPKEVERFIKGFYVEKDNMPNGYRTASPLLSPATRLLTDTSGSQVNGYIRYRVMAMYNDKAVAPGVERIYNYFPVSQPPVPQNLKAKSIRDNKKVTVSLAWDAPIKGDSSTSYYMVYASDPSSDRMVLVSRNEPAIIHEYAYTIDHGSAYTYRFCVSAIGKNGAESQYSDTVTVKAPTLNLPTPAINKIFTDNDKVMIQWDYPAIADLNGFRIFQDKNGIATETELNKDAREFTTPVLTEGMTYTFTIIAITDVKTVSETAVPQTITIPKKDK